MVNRVIGPTVCCGLGSLVSVTSPLQPNHRPPFCFSASSTPAARPPAVASPSWIGATRFETTTSRDIEGSASRAEWGRTAWRVAANLGGIAPPGHLATRLLGRLRRVGARRVPRDKGPCGVDRLQPCKDIKRRQRTADRLKRPVERG